MLFYKTFLMSLIMCSFFFFFNDTATTEIYTLSLHDALPICSAAAPFAGVAGANEDTGNPGKRRSEEHTSELQSHSDLVCRLLLEKKKNKDGDKQSVKVEIR